MKRTIVPFILFIFGSLATVQAGIPKSVSNGTKSLATVITYDKTGKMIGTAAAFFAGNDNEAYSAYEIFKNAVRAEVIDASGKKTEVNRICGANEIYDVVKFTTQAAPKSKLAIAEKSGSANDAIYIISSATTKKAVTLEAKISEAKAVTGGT